MPDRATILHLGEGERRQAWKEALADRPWESGTLVKGDGERAVWRANVLGSTVAVKVRPAEPLRTLVAGNEFTRHLAAARLLGRAGIQTASVFCLGRAGGDDVLVTEWLEGSTLLEAVARVSRDERAALLRSAGALIGRQLAAGLFNRDHKPSNVIVVSETGHDLALIDIAGVRRPAFATSSTFVTLGARMCASILIEPRGVGVAIEAEDLSIVVAEVVIGATTVWAGITASDLRRKMLERASAIIAAHGDPAPKVNPLDQPAP